MKEALYFSHDCDARYDSKILRLRRKHGWLGYGLFWAIIEKLRVESDYTLEADYENIAFEMQADAEVVKSIVCDFELFSFTEDGERFYSNSLTKRMQKSQDIAQKRKDAAAKRWGKEANAEQDDANAMQMQCNSMQIEKEKENINIYITKKKTLSKEREKESEPAERDSHALSSSEEKAISENSDLPKADAKIPPSPSCAPPLPPVGAKKTRARFIPPSVEEVRLYIAEKGYEVDAEAFVAFYTSKDWYVGVNKMKNWRAALVTWHKRPRSPDSGRLTQNYNHQHFNGNETDSRSGGYDPEGDARKAYIARKAAEAVAECNSRGC